MILVCLLLLLFECCEGQLKIWSPDALYGTTINTYTASFGNPSIFSQYGRMVLISSVGDCSIPASDLSNSFAVLYNYNNCYYSVLAQTVQSLNGIGMIIVDKNNNPYTIIPQTQISGSQISIFVILITNYDGISLYGYKNFKIWASYSYPITTSQTVSINFYMSSNYTLDKVYINELHTISQKFSLTITNFSMTFCSINGYALNAECLFQGIYEVCLQSTSSVHGSDMIKDSAVIINYFNTLPMNFSLTSFLDTLLQIYNTCEFDYSLSCISSIIPNASTNLYTLVIGSTVTEIIAPFWKLNSFNFFWVTSLEIFYCSILIPSPSNCQECSPGCSYSDLRSSNCNPSCNTISCGYSDLNCIRNNKCYNFMLGDGNCNSECPNDPDCVNSDQCAPGCLYSDMQLGNCPIACNGSCFSNCSNTFCSPNCKYADLSAGICSSDCSIACLKQCIVNSSDICMPGCKYSDMAKGMCPVECKSYCFWNCTKEYCGPDCTHVNANQGLCEPGCSDYCLSGCNVTQSLSHSGGYDVCVQGCNYSTMAQGYCPLACSDCSEYCPKKFCSPNCLYSDLIQGYCSEDCSEDCLNKYCNRTTSNLLCSPGCAFADMAAGLCPINCSDFCLNNYCMNIYCGQDCLYDSLYNYDGNCYGGCKNNDYCCYQQDMSSNNVNILAIVLPTVFGFVM